MSEYRVPNPPRQFVKPKDICERLGIAEATLRNWSRQGIIRRIKIGGAVRYPISEANRLMKRDTRRKSLPEETYYTVKQVAAILQIGLRFAYELVQTKKLPSVNLGRKTIRIPKSKLDEYIRDKMSEANHG